MDQKASIFVHPALCASPALIQAMQERLGMRAVVEGRRVRMVGTARPSGRPLAAPAAGQVSHLSLVGGRQS